MNPAGFRSSFHCSQRYFGILLPYQTASGSHSTPGPAIMSRNFFHLCSKCGGFWRNLKINIHTPSIYGIQTLSILIALSRRRAERRGWGRNLGASCEPTSRAASQSAEGGYCGNSTSVEWGRSGVKSGLGFGGSKVRIARNDKQI